MTKLTLSLFCAVSVHHHHIYIPYHHHYVTNITGYHHAPSEIMYLYYLFGNDYCLRSSRPIYPNVVVCEADLYILMLLVS